jgi:hypothetical protein
MASGFRSLQDFLYHEMGASRLFASWYLRPGNHSQSHFLSSYSDFSSAFFLPKQWLARRFRSARGAMLTGLKAIIFFLK